MKKQTIYIIIIAVLALIIIFLILKSTGNSASSIENPFKTLTEKEKYAAFGAKIACEFIGIGEDKGEDEMTAIITKVGDMTIESGYTYTEMQELNEKYQNDLEFQQIAYEEMKKQCPDKMKEAGITEFTPRV
ncbi:MAG: hypothetical protein Q8L29_00960 [archaeon]|nr:hypothetical protein [archaeon]